MKQKLLKTMRMFLAAALLGVGTTSAWAAGNKRVLNSQNYETADATDWTCTNGVATLKTGDATYGKYAQCYPSGSGNRTISKSVTLSSEPDGSTTAAMTTDGYNVEFDFVLVGGNVVQRSVSQFTVNTSGDPLFTLSQPSLAAEGANEGKSAGNTGYAVTTWYVNDLTNATDETVDLDGSTWYHLKLVVTATSAAYTITSNTTSEEVKSGSKTITGISKITGFGGQVGRGSGKLNFDNLEIYDYTATVSVTAPTFKFNKVDGAKRNYTITNPNGSGTLYYTTAPADVAPAEGDAAYSSTTEATATVDFSESGTYYAYVLHTNGTTTSPVTPQAVTAGTLTLTAPVFTVTDMVEATDGFFYPVITFASNNSSLEGAPTATFDVASPYTFTSTGSITVTASAEGYTSSSSTFTVNNKYSLSKTIDFGALTASDFDGATWTTATGAPRDYWTSRAAAIPADVTYYKLTNTSATAGDPDNSAVLDGITISNYNQRAPEVYIGYGLLTPYSSISGSSNYMNFKVNGGAATDYIVYNGWNNYGSGTFNTVLAGDATFGLYRYDTMLRTINVYSPASVPVTIPASGYATLASAYNLNLSSVSLFAYTVSSISNTAVTLSPISNNLIPANTGVILTGEAGNYNIDVQADAIEAITGNKLQAAVTATAVEANAAYILQDGEFHIVKNASTIPAGKAYLLATDVPAEARSLTFNFGDATGISAIAKSQEPNANGYYNLAGQRVAQPTKGLYIQDGKKVIIK